MAVTTAVVERAPRGVESYSLPTRLDVPWLAGRVVRVVVRPYGTATLLVGAAFLATFPMRGFFPYPFLFLFFAAVMGSAWFGGIGAGLFSVLLSTVIAGYFFVPPYDSFQVNATAASYFVVFIFCSLAASWVSASKRKSEEALREARDELGIRVSERTAELSHAHAELAHLSRVLTMGELTASIAHEINQPLTAVVAHGHACVEWLSAPTPNVREAIRSAERIVQDGTRAGAVIGRIRALFKKDAPARDLLDMNEVIRELIVFLRDEAMSQKIAIRMDLSPELPRVAGDRVRLQQVVLNLMVNSMDALRGTQGGAGTREIVVRSAVVGPEVQITVEDSGPGLSEEAARRVFDPFFTTKTDGIGMGLSISRTIIESHAGRLWATANAGRIEASGVSGAAVGAKGVAGARFQFSLPVGM